MGQQPQVERIRIRLECRDRKPIEQFVKKIVDASYHTGAAWQGPVDGLFGQGSPAGTGEGYGAGLRLRRCAGWNFEGVNTHKTESVRDLKISYLPKI